MASPKAGEEFRSAIVRNLRRGGYPAVVSGNVPASTRTLRVLTFLATQPGPVPMERIASAVGLPRSSTYHLLRAMIDEGFVVHLP